MGDYALATANTAYDRKKSTLLGVNRSAKCESLWYMIRGQSDNMCSEVSSASPLSLQSVSTESPILPR